jgi:UDP-2,4-diacetamido-2,4,6-trideoxy-beta-L-altropyranose hydrolase
MNKNLIIRADASVQIGTGHVMRCLTLADELRGNGVDVVFVCREFDGNFCSYIEEKGYSVHRLPVSDTPTQNINSNLKHAAWLGVDWQTDAGQGKEFIKSLGTIPDWLVVDHYALEERWEGYLRPYVKKIMVIDDIADRPHDCDLLLDQNFYENLESRYYGLVPSGCKKLLGPQYALLRPEFREARKKLRKRNGHVKRIMIFFGGSDPTNETTKALEAICMLNRSDVALDVVVGAANVCRANIQALCAKMQNVQFHLQTQTMAQLMVRADLFIGAGGATTWECCFVGLPAIIWAVAENQKETALALAKHNIIKFLGWYEHVDINIVVQAVQSALEQTSVLAAMSASAIRVMSNKCEETHQSVLLMYGKNLK